MRGRTETLKVEKIEAVCALVLERLQGTRAETADAFVRQFFANVAPQDLVDEEVEDLFGAAISIWTLGRERKAGQPRIRAYNPRFEEVGWQSTHTVIEIVNDDMPFLVDSVTAALNRLDLTVHIVIHPIIRVTRDGKGQVTSLLGEDDASDSAVSESYMHLQISEQTSTEALAKIEESLAQVLEDVRAAVEDWRTMRKTMVDVIEELEAAPPKGQAKADLAEVCAFLRWIEDNHFTFLGYRQYDYTGTGAKLRMEVVKNSGLGMHPLARRKRVRRAARHRNAAGTGPGLPARSDTASGDEGQQGLHGAPGGPAGLDQRQAHRQVRQGGRRAQVHRAVHLGRLQPESERDPAPPPPGREDRQARRLPAGEP
ncbi:MAG: hypothetical protein ACMVO3_04095 [Thalassobaculum sp.]